MPKLLPLVVCAVLLPTILGLAWFVGIFLEFEYPYFFQIRQAQTAMTPDGVPAKALLARTYPGARIRWHMCSYCYDLASPAGNLAHVRVIVPGREDFHFALHRASHQLVPMTERTASLFPDLMPPGDHLIRLYDLGVLDGEDLMIPSSWWGKQ